MEIVAHVITFAACLVAALEVSRSFVALIHLRWVTRIAAKVFFVATGVHHLALALDSRFPLVVYVQTAGLVFFLILLWQDISRSLRRLRLAFLAVHAKYGDDGDTMIATVTYALQRGKTNVRNRSLIG